MSVDARRYGIDKPLLFRWKRELAPPTPPVFLSVTMPDSGAGPEPVMAIPAAAPIAAPFILERSPHEIELELTGGRRIRFGRDTDPGTVRSMVAMLEGARP